MRALCLAMCAVAMVHVAPALAEDEPESKRPGLRAGADIFFGLSNIAGPTRRITDRQWAAIETFEPSVVYLDWVGHGDNEARLSIGIGDVYTGSDRSTRQPVECLWRTPASSGSLTLGKHYVPFGQQEWEYETRWGGMLEADLAGAELALSLTHNPDTQAVNAMVRLSRQFGGGVEAGISAAAGRGWSYSTSHAVGYCLDVVAEMGSVTLTGEGLIADGAQGRYSFGFIKAMSEVKAGWRPYVGAYYGHDEADEMGELRSGVAGVEIDVTPNLMIEPGLGRASGRNVWWLTARARF